jgi:hypothetical protein
MLSLVGTNILAYFIHLYITNNKKFIALTPEQVLLDQGRG